MPKLPPALKAASDAVYYTNTARYHDLYKWILQGRKAGFGDDAIALALGRYLEYAADIEQWWPYLDAILYKAAKDLAVAENNIAHAEIKATERERVPDSVEAIMRGIG